MGRVVVLQQGLDPASADMQPAAVLQSAAKTRTSSAGQNIIGCNAKLETTRRETAPKIFTAINIHFEVSGDNLDPELVAKVCADSLEKYCSVCLMLGAGVEMTHSWEII